MTDDKASTLSAYQQRLSDCETRLWERPEDPQRLSDYQQLFREFEAINTEPRYHFIVVVPVADRPQHLQACLGSILILCDSYGYGGKSAGRYTKVSVLVADDSRDSDNIKSHQNICDTFNQQGLATHYFGQQEQLAQLDKLTAEQRLQLAPIIGSLPSDAFYHKGASIMRNIAYLKLQEMVNEIGDCLIHFIDSDQEFQVKVATNEGERHLYGINYFHQLNTLFQNSDITMLTGKVVGDPPVSPSVMASNFLDDVHAFLDAAATKLSEAPCEFHQDTLQNCEDAAYHDMADLFGFKGEKAAFDYQCDLEGIHTHLDTFSHFANKLNRFFDGEHPTRKSYYEHQAVSDSVVAARTVYTGNYVFRAEALRYFIPFATLKLRMAGPVLGRIIKAEIGEQFVSANLPMLHKRTVDEIGQSEFRPGIEREHQQVDLSGEFERQFFGDVMLFSIATLAEKGYPNDVLNEELIRETVGKTEAKMLQNYTNKHQIIVNKIDALETRFNDASAWWNSSDLLRDAHRHFSDFIDNMKNNFGDDAIGFQQIHNEAHRLLRRQQISDAITHYHEHREWWSQVLKYRMKESSTA